MRLFVSAGEPSGDLHAASLLTALRRRAPGIELHGFGGERMEQAGCRIHYPLTDLAGVGFVRVLSSIPRSRHPPAGRPTLQRKPARRARSHRLSRLPLVAGQVRQETRHSRRLVRAAAAVGVGVLARQVDAASRRSRPLYAAV